ncbi:hypothetical protein QW131_28545 [Roseibium salinum]|nr:hypothetical protein [Roseibium salinum]
MRIENSKHAHEHEKRQDQQDDREHVDDEELQQQVSFAAEREAGEGISGRHAQAQPDDDGSSRDDE